MPNSLSRIVCWGSGVSLASLSPRRCSSSARMARACCTTSCPKGDSLHLPQARVKTTFFTSQCSWR
eukprot:11694262-Heterocapsa_arctica.AAC.1